MYFSKLIIILLTIVYFQSGTEARKCTLNVLVVMSSVDSILLTNGINHTIGFYFDEWFFPINQILQLGFNVTFTNPHGNTPPMDPYSNATRFFDPNDTVIANYLYNEARQLLSFVSLNNNFLSPTLLSSWTDDMLDHFDAVLIPGGHPPMVDLYKDPNLGEVLIHFHNAGKPTAMICHGPVASLSASLVEEPWVYKGYNMCVISTVAEKNNERKWGGDLPFYPETILSENGAVIQDGIPYAPHVVVSNELITGQNPYSAPLFAHTFAQQLLEYCNM